MSVLKEKSVCVFLFTYASCSPLMLLPYNEATLKFSQILLQPVISWVHVCVHTSWLRLDLVSLLPIDDRQV